MSMKTGRSSRSRSWKTDRIQILDFCDGHEEPAGYYAIGHFQPAFFRRAVLSAVGENEGVASVADLDAVIKEAIAEAPVWKGYWRTIKLVTVDPEVVDDEAELFETVPKGKRGSYPVTVMQVSW